MFSQWKVTKTGAIMFDQLHAVGLAVLLAYLTKADVHLEDAGVVYRLESAAVPTISKHLALSQLFPLPTIDEALNTDLSVTVLDGLLALLFTTPGLRVVSVADGRFQAQYRPDSMERSLQRVSNALIRWQTYIAWQERQHGDWITHLLPHYCLDYQQQFQPHPKPNRALSIPMTIDPTFSFASRQPFSNGLIAEKCNVAISGMPYAVLLAYLGATRWLRAQRVNGHSINYYVPSIRNMTVTSQTAMPLLPSCASDSQQALCNYWLTTWQLHRSQISALAFQVLQTQGARQSISIFQGCVGYSWLNEFTEIVGDAVVRHWQRLINYSQKDDSLELDLLQNSLLHRHGSEWRQHLRDYATKGVYQSGNGLRSYHLIEVREATKYMTMNQVDSLSAVLASDVGTIRFGFALRQLGKINMSAQREAVEALDDTRTQDRLLRVLADVNRACLLAKAQSDFIIIPDDTDLKGLLDDIARFGAHEIAGLLIILASLRYPKHDDN